MVAYKVRKIDGTWYTLGSGSQAKIRALDGSWYVEGNTGPPDAKVRLLAGTMGPGVPFGAAPVGPSWLSLGVVQTVSQDYTDATASWTADPVFSGSQPYVNVGGTVTLEGEATAFRPNYPEVVFCKLDPSGNLWDARYDTPTASQFRIRIQFEFDSTPALTLGDGSGTRCGLATRSGPPGAEWVQGTGSWIDTSKGLFLTLSNDAADPVTGLQATLAAGNLGIFFRIARGPGQFTYLSGAGLAHTVP